MYAPKIYMNDSKYNLLIKDNLSIKDIFFVLVPKCPLFGGSSVYSTELTYVISKGKSEID